MPSFHPHCFIKDMIFIQWLDSLITALAKLALQGTLLSYPHIVQGLVAVLLACLICGAVGSIVVGNRMAFFSDALAHCAFAGVSIGLITALFTGSESGGTFDQIGIPLIMIVFGVMVGLAIAYVREKTALANDTVIGVFFAGAIGFGAMLFKMLNTRSFISPENFLFGDPMFVSAGGLLMLILLVLVTGGVLVWIYNRLVFASFNSSLARSRQISLQLCNYVFIALLALIVNLCVTTVGALLINALLVVPAATASNVSRNMRQLFWLSIGLSVIAGFAGSWISLDVGIPNPKGGSPIHFGWSGCIVVISVMMFFASMAVVPWVRGKQTI